MKMKNKKTRANEIEELIRFIISGDFIERYENVAQKNEDHSCPATKMCQSFLHA